MKLNFPLSKSFFCLIFTLSVIHFSFGQNATNGGQIGYDQTIYSNQQPDSIINISIPSGGNPDLDLEYTWLKGNPTNNNWEPAPGIINKEFYIPPILNQTTYFYRVARRAGYTQYQAGSNIIIIIILSGNVDDAGIIGMEQTVMINEQPDTLFEIEPPSGGNPDLDFEFEWVKIVSPNNEEPAEGIIDQPYYVPPPLTETTTFRRKARRAEFTGYLNSNSVTIEVEPTSIDNFNISSIKLYPNPITTYLQIEFKDNTTSDWLVEVFDIKGSLQKTIKFKNVQDNQTINLQDLAKGTYLIQLTDLKNGKVESFKILKE